MSASSERASDQELRDILSWFRPSSGEGFTQSVKEFEEDVSTLPRKQLVKLVKKLLREGGGNLLNIYSALEAEEEEEGASKGKKNKKNKKKAKKTKPAELSAEEKEAASKKALAGLVKFLLSPDLPEEQQELGMFLALPGCFLNDSALPIIKPLFFSPKSSLAVLDLSLNKFSDAGAKELAQWLSSGQVEHLYELDLTLNYIGIEGFNAFADALASDKTPLRKLNLQMQNIDKSDFTKEQKLQVSRSFLKALENNDLLISLKLGMNDIPGWDSDDESEEFPDVDDDDDDDDDDEGDDQNEGQDEDDEDEEEEKQTKGKAKKAKKSADSDDEDEDEEEDDDEDDDDDDDDDDGELSEGDKLRDQIRQKIFQNLIASMSDGDEDGDDEDDEDEDEEEEEEAPPPPPRKKSEKTAQKDNKKPTKKQRKA